MESKPHVFWDSDIAKWIEAASFSLATHPDDALDKQIDKTVELLVSAQQPDGYLNTYFTVVEPGKRWTDLRDAHELYCAGHLMEAAVAHYGATGKRKLLEAICRYADHIADVFGPGPDQKHGYCGHPEIELALVKLYRTTGNEKYLELSRFFVDERGSSPNYFDLEAEARAQGVPHFNWYYSEPGRLYSHEYNQSHLPVREQDRVTGHSVRAVYLYSAMVDLAVETGDDSLLKASERLWNHLREKQLYITGGIGPSDRNEGFTADYDLPNESAYCETCASVGLVFWNHRMLHADPDGKYADMMEQALYNGVISGVSFDGKKFFYDNPLASQGHHHRKEWFDVSCCPANLSRLLSTFGQYPYSEGEDGLSVHLYVQGDAKLRVGGREVTIHQKTAYPWNGDVAITVEPESAGTFDVKLRVPGWCKDAQLSVNGESVAVQAEKGYVRLHREWQAGDTITWHFAMPVERVYAHPAVEADRGRVAIRRGPVVYCLEAADNGSELDRLLLPPDAELTAEFEQDLLGGITVVRGKALRVSGDEWDGALYGPKPAAAVSVDFTAIPYYAWDNREPGEMLIWIREAD
jgi:DUF1680 family protein